MGSIVAELVPHPQSKPEAVRSIQVGIGREAPDLLFVMFKLVGDLSRIQLREDRASVWTDNLWRNTCFECFVRDAGKARYREFNFAPGGAWAAYDFTSYREGMREVGMFPPWGVEAKGDEWMTIERHCVQHQDIEPRRMFDWQVGLSAVIEETDGTESYWALAHPPGKPDFHHPDCFALELPPPEYSYEVRD